jgi:hypothetical protein
LKSHDDNRVNLLVSRKHQTPVVREFFPIPLRSPHHLTYTYSLNLPFSSNLSLSYPEHSFL